MPRRPTEFTPPTPVTTNSAVNVIFDSTYGFHNGDPSSTVVGPLRGMFANRRLQATSKSTTQDVTLRMDVLDTSSTPAWVTGYKTQTVTAGTDQPIDWLSPGGDWRVVQVNGGTGPATIKNYGCVLVDGDRASGA